MFSFVQRWSGIKVGAQHTRPSRRAVASQGNDAPNIAVWRLRRLYICGVLHCRPAARRHCRLYARDQLTTLSCPPGTSAARAGATRTSADNRKGCRAPATNRLHVVRPRQCRAGQITRMVRSVRSKRRLRGKLNRSSTAPNSGHAPRPSDDIRGLRVNTTTALLTAPDVDGKSVPARREGQSVRRPWLPSAMAQAGDVMTTPVATIDASASMWEAARRLFGTGETHLVVVDGTRPVGILNETVLALQWPCGPLSAYRQEVRDVTLGRVHSVLPQVAVSKVAEIMLDDAVDAVPVVTPRGVVVGLVTRRDLIELITRLPTPVGSWGRAEDRPATPDADSLPDLAALPRGGTSCGTSLSARR